MTQDVAACSLAGWLAGDLARRALTMASYTLDAQCPVEPSDTGFSAGVPDPSIVSAEDANV